MSIRKAIIKIISTFFYIGYLPLIPGTFGSIAGVSLYYLLKDSISIYTIFSCILIILGFLVSGPAERILNKKDARCIVIDEVCGMLLSLIFLPYDIKIVVLAFILFRILDALKPFPSDRLQRLKGGPGIMADDLVAGLYTNIILQIVLKLASFKAS
jgi:phosphatidylglycerophosphatase A